MLSRIYSGAVSLSLLLCMHCGGKNNLINDYHGADHRAWPDGSAIELHLHTTVPDEYKDAISRAVEKQNSVLERTLIFINGDTKKKGFAHATTSFTFEDVLKDPYNVVYFTDGDLPGSDSGSSNPDAITQTWFEHGEIGGGDIIFKNSQMKVEKQVEVVMLHELGHLLGLDHNDTDANDIMHPIVTTSHLDHPFTPAYCRALAKRYSVKNCSF